MMQTDPGLDLMESIAAPLDDWCGFCGLHLAAEKTDEGTPICGECAQTVRETMASLQASRRPNRAQRRAMKKALKRRGRGYTR